MVTKSNTSQYMSRMGQKTGTSNTGKKVTTKPNSSALNDEYLRAHRVSACLQIMDETPTAAGMTVQAYL